MIARLLFALRRNYILYALEHNRCDYMSLSWRDGHVESQENQNDPVPHL